MEMTGADKEWNQMVTLLSSDDAEEREHGVEMREELCAKWPGVCEMVKEKIK